MGHKFNLSIEDFEASTWYGKYRYAHIVWPQIEFDWMAQHIEPGEIIIDGGSHQAVWALLFGILANSGSVFGFETSQHNVNVANKNIGSNNVPNVEVFHNALSDSHTPTVVMDNSGGIARTGSTGSTSVIDSITLDEFCSERTITPTLVKIDVEGHEIEVLKGMQNVLQNLPKLMLELSNFAFTDVDKYVREVFSLIPISKYTGTYQVDAGTEMIEFDRLTESDLVQLSRFANPHVYLLPRA